MSMRYPGGFIASTPVTAGYPSGVWTQAQAIPYQAQNVWTRDQYWPYTTLLLQGNGTNGAQNNTFLDSSSNNFTITRNGNTTQGSFTPYEANGYWSNYFDGNTDSLSVANNTAFNLSSGDFTIEAWVFSTARSGNYVDWIVGKRGQSNPFPWSWAFVIGSDTKLGFSNGTVGVGSASTINLNQWYHIAAVRSGSTISLYINGAFEGSSTAIAITEVDTPLTIGNYPVDNPEFTGYISNLRILKGTALYTSSFTPPTAPLTAITNTSLLTCQSNRFIDNSTNAFAITRNGDASVQAFQPLPGATTYSGTVLGGSGYFDGTGDYLTAASNDAFRTDQGDWTIEGWIYVNSTASNVTLVTRGVYLSVYGYYFGTSGSALYFEAGTGGWATSATYTSTSNAVIAGQWNHIAAVRSGTTFSMYSNGARVFTQASASFGANVNASLFIGTYFNVQATLNGFMADLRFVKGTALYTGTTYTVPTAPLTAVTNTSLLLNYTNAGIFDAAVMNDLETVGNAQVSTSVVKYGTGSMAFDGSGDYLLPRPGTTDLFAFGSGDWTLEFWVYPVSSTGMLIDWRPTSTSGAYITLYLGSGVPYLFVNTADRITGTAIPSSAWTHLAICRSGTSTRMFINGTQAGSTYSDSTVYLNSAGRPLIAANGFDLNGSPVYFNGYIDDLRITKGAARYLTSFTPPPARMPGQ